MTLSLQQTVALGILSASIHWLVARSEITRPVWSLAKGRLAALLACPACSGFWIGLGLGGAGVRALAGWYVAVEVLASGLIAMFLTPVFQAVMLWGLDRTAIVEDTTDEASTRVPPIPPPRP